MPLILIENIPYVLLSFWNIETRESMFVSSWVFLGSDISSYEKEQMVYPVSALYYLFLFCLL